MARPSAWVAQNGQCWTCTAALSDWSITTPAPLSTLTSRVPATLQISVQTTPRAVATAWEMDGISVANSIAQHAIQAAIRCVILFIPITSLYQRGQLASSPA